MINPDPVWLRSFVAVARSLNFSRAARELGVRQSTVSQHVKRLEEHAGRRLFVRDTHSVALTADGQAMVGFAREILAANHRAMSHFANAPVRGLLRFGAGEDVVATRLSDILRAFRDDYPFVDLELTVALSGTLHQKLAARELDLVLAKRQPGEDHGRLVWRDELVWVGTASTRIDPAQPVPLIAYPPPSITRARAVYVLERCGRPWQVTCTSTSLSGVRAAVLAGLGVTVHSRSLVPAGLVPLLAESGLPAPGEVEFVLATAATAPSKPATALIDTILANSGQLHRPSSA